MTAIASLLTNAFKTVQPSAKDKEDTYRRAIVCQPVDFFMVTANTQRRNLFYFRCICRYLRACLKKAFCKMCVTICGIFCPDEGAVAGYGN